MLKVILIADYNKKKYSHGIINEAGFNWLTL